MDREGLAALWEEIGRLRTEVASLRVQLAALQGSATRGGGDIADSDHSASTMPPQTAPSGRVGRRAALTAAVASGALLAGCARPSTAATKTSQSAPTPQLLIPSGAVREQMHFGEALNAQGNSPALGSSVTWSRFRQWTSPGGTSQLLSLIFEAQGPGAFPWPLYIQLVSATTSVGNATGAYVRLYNEDSGWGASYHTDLFHIGSGTSIGVNVELTRTDSAKDLPGGSYPTLPAQPTGRAIGLNILNTGHSQVSGDQAINIQANGPSQSWDTAVNIEPQNSGTDGVAVAGSWVNGVHLMGSGASGLTVDGQFTKGITLTDNDIQLSSGSRVYFDTNGEVYMQFNSTNSHLEFVYSPRGVIGYIDVLSATSHEM